MDRNPEDDLTDELTIIDEILFWIWDVLWHKEVDFFD